MFLLQVVVGAHAVKNISVIVVVNVNGVIKPISNVVAATIRNA